MDLVEMTRHSLVRIKIHEYQVHMTCEGCSGAVEKVLSRHKDTIKDVDINLAEQKVKVMTSLSADAVLELIKKTGKEVAHLNTK